MPEEWKEVGNRRIWHFDGESMDDPILTGHYDRMRTSNTQFGEQAVYDLTRPDGEKVSVWGTVILDRKMADCVPGLLTRIELIGMNGDAKDFRVFQQAAG